MNEKRMGNFIKELRIEKNWSQDYLANMIPISRQSISKWELGIAIPDVDNIKKLSEIFDVSIDEIFAGERNTKQNVSLNLYETNTKIRKKLKISIIISILSIILLLFSYFIYYFINLYGSINIYNITTESDLFKIENGLFIKTNEELYFNIGNIISNNQIEKINLIYLKDNKEIVLYSSDSSSILLKDYNGYEEYFNFKEINSIINNLYIKVFIKDNNYIVKLKFTEDYINNNIFFLKKKKISQKITENDNLFDNDLVSIIKSNFKREEDVYKKTIIKNNYNVTFNYYEDINTLNIELLKDGDFVEEYSCNFNINYFTYINYIDNYSFNYTLDKDLNCIYGNCDNYLNKISELKELINEISKN